MIQTLIALLDALAKDRPWEYVRLEPPDPELEKIDLLWEQATGTRAVQVKSSQNQIGKADAERWAGELEAHHGGADELELVLVGPSRERGPVGPGGAGHDSPAGALEFGPAVSSRGASSGPVPGIAGRLGGSRGSAGSVGPAAGLASGPVVRREPSAEPGGTGRPARGLVPGGSGQAAAVPDLHGAAAEPVLHGPGSGVGMAAHPAADGGAGGAESDASDQRSGGVGKTQTVLEYAHQYRGDYDAVFWISAASELELRTEYAQIAARLGLPHDAGDAEGAMRAARRWLESSPDRRWLLVFDNADDPQVLEVLQGWLPSGSPAGHVLVTSRARVLEALGLVSPLALATLPAAESTAFLLKRTGREQAGAGEVTGAAELARELDGLPLALEQAAAYVLDRDVPFAEYLASYRRQRLALLEQRGPQSGAIRRRWPRRGC